MKKYIAEFIGTFFLVLTIGCVVLKPGDAGAMAPLAIGSILMVMIFAGGYISGAHYNPAVTLAVWLRGKCATADLPGYVIAQLAGAALAAGVALLVKNTSAPVPVPLAHVLQALLAEFLFTFALCYVVLNVATAKGTSGNPTYGLAIGFTVLAGAYSVGNISGAAFNPAVAVGITVMGLSSVTDIWIFFVANLAGGAAAAGVFKVLNPEDR
jgi:aquaporin Z